MTQQCYKASRWAFSYLYHSMLANPSEWAAHQFTFSESQSYYSHRISLILLQTFANCFITLSFSPSHGSCKVYRMCIQLITPIVLHPCKTSIHWLLNLVLSDFIKFIPYKTRTLSFDSDPVMSSWGARNRLRITEWDTTAEHAVWCLWDEFKRWVNELGHFDNVKQSVS